MIACLAEGNSIRSTVRRTGVAKNTVTKLLVETGAACSKYQDEVFRNLNCKRIQFDEIWSFVYATAKNVKPEHSADGGYAGDVWTWTAIDADSKLVPCWMVGGRDEAAARDFIEDLAGRLANRVQLPTDGYKAYLTVIEKALQNDIDYAMLLDIYGQTVKGQKRYSPAECVRCETHSVPRRPDPEHVSTNYVERANPTIRMSMRGFTRLTNAFSKKVDNHAAALALHCCYYNFVRVHKTLKTTPAIAAGVTTKRWQIAYVVALLEGPESNCRAPKNSPSQK